MMREKLHAVILIGLIGLCAAPLWAADTSPDRNQLKKDYPVLGFVIGTPSLGLDAIVGYDLGPVEFRLSGGVGNSDYSANGLSWGVQANLGYKILDTRNVVGQVELFGNYINLGKATPSQVAGVGTAVSLFLYGCFANAGLGVNLLPTNLTGLEAVGGLLDLDFQIGYMYRFN
ncbi:MAG TPA: hypothetical protein VMW87_09535 [Spirochaetia bacterium]|nr:hypothetical protein [Spirochaetia bacterium]